MNNIYNIEQYLSNTTYDLSVILLLLLLELLTMESNLHHPLSQTKLKKSVKIMLMQKKELVMKRRTMMLEDGLLSPMSKNIR